MISNRALLRWRLLGEMALVMFAFFVFSGLIGLLFYRVNHGFEQEVLDAVLTEEGQQNLMLAAFFAVPFAMFATLVVVDVLLRWRRLTLADIGLRAPESWQRTMVYGIALGVVCYALGVGIIFGLEQLGWTPAPNKFSFVRENVIFYFFGMTAIAWFSGGFVEEVIFRGFFMNSLHALFGRGRWAAPLAILLQGLLFSGLHLPEDILGVLPIFAMGLIFGWAYYSFGQNLWLLVIGHAVYDNIGFTLLYWGS
jgi:CAAX protease family protein